LSSKARPSTFFSPARVSPFSPSPVISSLFPPAPFAQYFLFRLWSEKAPFLRDNGHLDSLPIGVTPSSLVRGNFFYRLPAGSVPPSLRPFFSGPLFAPFSYRKAGMFPTTLFKISFPPCCCGEVSSEILVLFTRVTGLLKHKEPFPQFLARFSPPRNGVYFPPRTLFSPYYRSLRPGLPCSSDQHPIP